MVQANVEVAVTGYGLTMEWRSGRQQELGLTPIHSVGSMSADVGFGDPGIAPATRAVPRCSATPTVLARAGHRLDADRAV